MNGRVNTTYPAAGATEELRRLAESLAPGCWPSADETALVDCGRRLRGIGDELRDLADVIDALRRDHDGSGRFHDGLIDALTQVTSDVTGMRGVADRFAAFATSLDAFALATVDARAEMTLLASIADRDRLAGSVADALGDDSARVSAASAGRYALSAAGDEYTGRAGDAGDSAAQVADSEQRTESTPPAATSGMMAAGGFGALGALGASAGGALQGARAVGAQASTPDIDPTWLIERAAILQTSLPSPFSEWMRVAIGVGTDADGGQVRVVATSDPQPYQRPGFAIAPSELLAGDGGPPEYAIVAEMARARLTPVIVASAMTMPQGIASVLVAEGVAVASPPSPRT